MPLHDQGWEDLGSPEDHKWEDQFDEDQLRNLNIYRDTLATCALRLCLEPSNWFICIKNNSSGAVTPMSAAFTRPEDSIQTIDDILDALNVAIENMHAKKEEIKRNLEGDN